MVRRDRVSIRLITRRGNDWSDRFPLVVEAVNHLKVRSASSTGRWCAPTSGACRPFHILRRRRNEALAFLFAFDLLEVDGTDLRREPIEVRKATLASILRKARHGVRLNEHLEPTPADLGLRHCLEAAGLALPLRPLAGLAQVQEPRSAGGETGVRGGLESLTIAGRRTCNAASHRRPGSRSPALASSIIFFATASRVGLTMPSVCWRATRAISKAMPMRRVVSASNR